MKISSSNLYHHTSTFKNLLSIIKNGFEHRLVKESLPFSEPPSSTFNIPGIIRYDFNFKAVCFTDLPSDQIANHIDQYGKYVIGLSKDWGIANGITPIRYIHHYTPDIYNNNFRFITDFIERYPQSKNDIIDLANDFLKQAGKNDFITSSDISNLPEKFNFLIMMYDQIIKDICSLVYTHFGLMRIYEERVMNVEKQKYEQKIYYNEREWRSLDTIGEKANLNFHAYDISGIYVTNKDEIKELITFFEKNKTKYEIDNMKSFKEKIKLINEL